MRISGHKFLCVWYVCTILVAIGEWICDLIFEFFIGRPLLDASHRTLTEAGLFALVLLLAFPNNGDAEK